MDEINVQKQEDLPVKKKNIILRGILLILKGPGCFNLLNLL